MRYFYRNDLKTVIKKKIALQEKINKAKSFNTQNNELLALTKEDLTSKLLQRADFVARREELDQALELFKKSNGDEFLAYCQSQEKQMKSKFITSDEKKIKTRYIDLYFRSDLFAMFFFFRTFDLYIWTFRP